MNDPIITAKGSGKKKVSCCLILLIFSCLCLACLTTTIFLGPSILTKLGFTGRTAKEVYQLAPDQSAGKSLTSAFVDRNIPGVRVIVIPISGEPTSGAFIILDSSKGYTGLSPMSEGDTVFLSLLKDLVERNRRDALRIKHVTVDYRDEQGISLLSFTVDQKTIEKYADGAITREEFYRSVHFNLLDTLQRMGFEDLLKEVQP